MDLEKDQISLTMKIAVFSVFVITVPIIGVAILHNWVL